MGIALQGGTKTPELFTSEVQKLEAVKVRIGGTFFHGGIADCIGGTMLREQKNSKKQGDVGHGIAIGWFAQNGYTVCIPLTDSQDYDLVVEKDYGLKKVQVKTTYHKSRNGVFKAHLRVCGGNRSGNTVKKFQGCFADFLFIVTEDSDKYLIPTNELMGASYVNLGKMAEKFRVF